MSMNEDKLIQRDRMRFTKNTLSSGLALLAILFNVLYFVSIYKSDVGTYYYSILVGASIIYNSTVEEDQAKLWDNPKVKKGLEAQGKTIINALDVIEAVLLPGEKDRIMDIIDDINGYNSEEVQTETAKN